MRRAALAALTTISTAALAVAAALTPPFFLGAPAGTAVPFESLVLPVVTGAPAALHLPLLQPFAPRSPFTPPLRQLLEGETVITTDRQMREVWGRLFSAPYDEALFDFDGSFVVLMGGGEIANGSFDITAVERVEASYSNPGGPGGDPATEAFLSLTSTTFLSGVQPKDPLPASWRVSAVKISLALLDDLVFRRNTILGV